MVILNIIPYVFNLSFTTCSFIFFLFLMIVTFHKNAVYSIKNRIFRRILGIGVLGFLLILSYLLLIHYTDHIVLIGLTKKFILLSFDSILLFWIYYVFILIFEKNSQVSDFIRQNHGNIDLYLLFTVCVLTLVDLFLPINIVYGTDQMVRYVTGAGVVFPYVVAGILAVLPIPCIVKQPEVSHKRLMSYYFTVFFVLVLFIIRWRHPSIVGIGFFFTILCYYIYYRLENPDIVYIRNYYKNRERLRSLREKYGFLFNMSPELRDLLNEISFMKENYLMDGGKILSKRKQKLDTLIQDFIRSSEDGVTTQTNMDEDGVEILDLEQEVPDEMLVTKEIYSLDELKEVLKEDNLPKW